MTRFPSVRTLPHLRRQHEYLFNKLSYFIFSKKSSASSQTASKRQNSFGISQRNIEKSVNVFHDLRADILHGAIKHEGQRGK